jgi:hypothetical protein
MSLENTAARGPAGRAYSQSLNQSIQRACRKNYSIAQSANYESLQEELFICSISQLREPAGRTIQSLNQSSSRACRKNSRSQSKGLGAQGGRPVGDVLSKGTGPPQVARSQTAERGESEVGSLHASLEGLDRAVKEATQGESLQHRLDTLEASNAALHADLARAVEALQAAARKESRDYQAIQTLRRQVRELPVLRVQEPYVSYFGHVAAVADLPHVVLTWSCC